MCISMVTKHIELFCNIFDALANHLLAGKYHQHITITVTMSHTVKTYYEETSTLEPYNSFLVP